ncbi:MAG TPA: GNAT family N-acetyltransferase [Gaiellaceae bacterium]|nr:GNAT family N-acetyltransferase [Gaiellaceae bacterium]
MNDDLARAYAFLARGDTWGNRSLESTVGTAVYLDELPRRLDANYLRVEHEATPEEVEAEARRLRRRMVFVPDAELGERLVPYFDEQGWRVSRVTVMAQLREPDRSADLGLVEEVTEEELRPARLHINAGTPWGRPEVMEQLFAGKHVIGRLIEARYFAVKVGGEVVSYTDLYQDGAEAQVEDVATLHEHRGRGYATAVVLAAIAAARERGAEFVCLVADYEDWPKELYRRLGFDELGYYVKFIAPAT